MVVPSVDIRRGRCVQMVGGRTDTERVYGDPVEIAQRWVGEGAGCLHIVDLDAAMGVGDNFLTVAEVIASVGVKVQVGGGIRTFERANELLGIGTDRVILGTAAVRSPELVKQLVEMAGGDRVMVALDSRSGLVAVEGWKEQTERTVIELAAEFEKMGVGSILFTNVDVEGSMRGVAELEVMRLVRGVGLPVFAAGGVGSLEDVRIVRDAGAAGVIIGMALYEGRFTLKQAMEVAGDESWKG